MGQSEDLIGPHVDGVMEQEVDDELILFNPATETYFTLNRSAREVWELADGSLSLEQIADSLAARYDMAGDTLVDDVKAIVVSFEDANLI